VGKSTFIEALGLALIDEGHKVAVLAIDPSSTVNGGSILGDKTRMAGLAVNDGAYVRPSPASGTLGGVAEKTRETLMVCEAAGYDVVIIETVGVGQSEMAVAHMTDFFVLLQLPNAGDDLQAIKRGVMELADVVVVHKADLDPQAAALAQSQILSALRLTAAHDTTQVLCLSALCPQQVAHFWGVVQRAVAHHRESGRFDQRRQAQSLTWMWDLIRARLMTDFQKHPAVQPALLSTEQAVEARSLAPGAAARALLRLFEKAAS
jgi:LAO/AO transport system kinase